MRSRILATAVAAAVASVTVAATPGAFASTQSTQAVPIAAEQQVCDEIYGGIFNPPSSEPLARCQWDMAVIHAD